MTTTGWLVLDAGLVILGGVGVYIGYLIGARLVRDRTWKLATKESNAQFKGYRDTINKLIRDCQDIRDDFRARTGELDGLVAEYRGQRDAAQAGVVAAHIERDAAQANWATVIAECNELNMANRMLSDNCQRLSSDNARLIEENGRLIAASVGGIDGATADRIAVQVGAARHWLETAIKLLPEAPDDEDVSCHRCGRLGDGCRCEDDEVDGDDDKSSGEVMAAHHEPDNGEDRE